MSATHNISHWESVTVDISEDADLSTAFDARAGSQYGLIVPSNFDGSVILFHGSYDNITYYPIEGSYMTVAASTAYGALPGVLSPYPWWKIETVTDQSTSDTVFTVVAKGGAGSGRLDALSGTATVTSVNDTASSTTLLVANGGRKGAVIFNDSTSTLYVKFGATASATDFTMKLGPGESGYLTQPVYTGRIDGIWSADASGAARVTELT